MSLRCSLLGHEYGASEIEREREERGNEVVISVTELERCVRCDRTRTISENTEVTQRSPRSPRSPPPENRGTELESGLEPGPTRESEPEPGPGSGGDASPAATPDEPGPRADRGAPSADADADTGGDDSEILDTDEGDAERDPRDWPDIGDHGSNTVDDPGTWPSIEAEDEGFDASTPGGEAADVEFGGGLTPRATDRGAEIIEGEADENSADADTGTAAATDTEFVRAGWSSAPNRPADPGTETELYCPNCNIAGLGDRESLRAGDICPECQRGYLAQRAR